MSASDDLDALIEEYHAGLAEFVRGDASRFAAVFSQSDDVTIANPFGPARRGWADALATFNRAAAHYSDGTVAGFDEISRGVGTDMAYLLEVERYVAKMGGAAEAGNVALRVTSVFRRDDAGAWSVVHRHADTILSERPPESVVQD
jgi:ketosteroid isomerase-like protein